ncbi:MAG: hypothetical protein AB7D06_02495 [Pedobacter sp.]
MKHNIKRYSYFIFLFVCLQGCSEPTLRIDGVIEKSTQCSCKALGLVMIIPSYGIASDALMTLSIKNTGNDEGFYQNFSTAISQGHTDFTLYCQSSQKLAALISNTFSHYEDNILEGIRLCVVSLSDRYADTLRNEANRVGAIIEFVE